MAIPDYQTLMLPLLKYASDGKEHVLSEATQSIADEFRLSDDERRQLLPSGRDATFNNRLRWSLTYLAKARLLERPGRGRFQITDRGRATLEENPQSLNLKFLMQFPEFQGVNEAATIDREPVSQVETPEELLESSYQNLRSSLAQELLQQVKASPPRFFEELVVDLLVAMGYGGSRRDAGQAVGQSGDGGIDGIIKEDRLGLDVVYIQAKRWEAAVGRPVVQAFAGSLEGHRSRKGVLITTSQFTHDAKEYVDRIEKRIILVDGEQMAQLMIDFNIGVAPIATYEVKKLDLDYFPEATQA